VGPTKHIKFLPQSTEKVVESRCVGQRRLPKLKKFGGPCLKKPIWIERVSNKNKVSERMETGKNLQRGVHSRGEGISLDSAATLVCRRLLAIVDPFGGASLVRYECDVDWGEEDIRG